MIPVGSARKPIRWQYYQEPDRRNLYDTWAALINLRTSNSTFLTTNYTLNLAGDIKTIYLNDNNMDVVVVGNFDVTPKLPSIGFQHDGWWYEYFSGDSIQVSNNNHVIPLDEGDYRLYTDVKLPAPIFTVPTSVEEIAFDHGSFPMLLWPNPSHGTAELMYTLEGSAVVSIQVFDLSGRQVANLSEDRMAPGTYTVDLDGSNWGAGRYVVRVQAGDEQGWKFMDIK